MALGSTRRQVCGLWPPPCTKICADISGGRASCRNFLASPKSRSPSGLEVTSTEIGGGGRGWSRQIRLLSSLTCFLPPDRSPGVPSLGGEKDPALETAAVNPVEVFL